MDEERRPANFPRLRSLIEKFRSKEYRDSYIAAHTRRFLAHQMRKFRCDKSQAEFGQLIDKRQTVVSQLEDPKYGKWTLQTLFDVAAKLNVAVLVRFVDHTNVPEVEIGRRKFCCAQAASQLASVGSSLSHPACCGDHGRNAWSAFRLLKEVKRG